jgi:hypothetical protein
MEIRTGKNNNNRNKQSRKTTRIREIMLKKVIKTKKNLAL